MKPERKRLHFLGVWFKPWTWHQWYYCKPSDIYECSNCHETFIKDWTDEEAEEEYEGEFGVPYHKAIAEIVCDNCYNVIMGNKRK